MFEKLMVSLKQIRETKPLVLNITNYVTMDFLANSLLALGAAPIMSEEEQELTELVNIAGSVNLNIGTLNDNFLQRAEKVIAAAKKSNKPIVLDPVGAGATQIRTKAALKFLPDVSIVRGNASEIMALHTAHIKTLGVETMHAAEEAVTAGKNLNQQYNVVIAISGATDIIVAKDIKLLGYGSSLMPRITGMGCALTGVIAAFHAITENPFEAALLATAYFGLCGEQAEKRSSGPGSFRTAFIDSLYVPDLEMMQKKLS
jgi:hydroxyethylthiazole kinase